jgi:mgtE-like transporter
VGWLVAAALLAGIVATVMASAVAYYSTIASVRIGLDPDTYGIPLVTSTMDLLGAFALILAIEVLAFT